MKQPYSKPLNKKDMLGLVMEELGYDSETSLMEDVALDSIVPGVCRNCDTVADCCEPDATKNWCQNCEGNFVVAVTVLMGII